MNAAKAKWIIKGGIPPEILFGLICEPQGGIESTTPQPTRLSEKELAKLKSQNGVSRAKSRRNTPSSRAS